MNNNKKLLRNMFEHIYGKTAVDLILKPNSLQRREYIKLKDYKRTKNDQLKGCSVCRIKKNLSISKQDFPRWSGNIEDKEYIITGLEVSSKVEDDLHICYSNGIELDDAGRHMFKNLRLIIDDINLEDKSYITDICKCLSNKRNISRRKCVDEYFLEEIKLLFKINPDRNIKLIIQGITVSNLFKKYIKDLEEEPITKNNKKFRYFLYGRMKFNEKIPVIIVPHTTRQMPSCRDRWKLIENEKRIKIKNIITNLFQI